jgi:hypothetical protein
MITFLVAGRNDHYGVNLDKRTAISLNQLATLCEGPDDEIIYVDCNTPAHDLTLAEAIADTLTPQARQRLRVFRISSAQMLQAIGETPLPFSDELSRNVGIRRANPRNQWLLSTNCDILIQPLGRFFVEILKKLPPAFYVCPRVSIPIPQWQMLDRMDVGQISAFCDQVIQQGFRLAAERPEPWLRFASVGDFQLAPREQWLKIRGCEEAMKFWGHSDANNSKRLALLNGAERTPDLSAHLRVFHLDHNPPVVASHATTLVRNDWKTWVDEIADYRSRNPENWGLADVDLPEIRLGQRAGLDAKAILATNPRQRTFLSSLRLKFSAGLWQTITRLTRGGKQND